MLFKFIKYTQPAWQFNLEPKIKDSFASCYVSDAGYLQEPADERYETKSAAMADIGYRLWCKGVLLESAKEEIKAAHEQPGPSLKDEYLFIRKFWGTPWATFAFMLRLCTFKNPVNECSAYFKTKSVQRINPYENPVVYSGYETYQSALIAAQPLVAVIIPTLNRYAYLKDVLYDLEKQTYSNFDVIVVDQSDNFDENFYKEFKLRLKLSHQKEKLLWTARNNAVKSTAAEYLLFFDDDSRVGADWIEQHLKCIDFFGASISAGVSLAAKGQKVPANYSFFRWADQFDSGNAMIRRSVMQHIGLYNEQFNGLRMGDGEFGFRAYINGIKSISNYKAPRIHLKVSTGGLRQMGSWDGFRSKKWFAPKPVPSVVYLFKKYFPDELCNNALFIGIMLSNVPYKYKRSSTMLLLSVLLTVIKSPLLLLQFYKSKK
ncbi:MAG TPA: glycosyltransferase family A protein, partial [Panacibacter sp.]|nr:glycosyltransferase family A protein [Panacibacter sp.]